jgi:hypothetical protein
MADQELLDQLDTIEEKLDAILEHLGIDFEEAEDGDGDED